MTFEQYAAGHLAVLRATARAVCADTDLADDLVQDVLVKMWSQWPRISAVHDVDAYVRRMLVNEFLSWRRKWGRLIPHADPSTAGRRNGDGGPADPVTPDDGLLREVRALPARQRVVIGLRYYADYSDAQIAEVLGCAQSTVRVHAARGLATLRITQPARTTADQKDTP